MRGSILIIAIALSGCAQLDTVKENTVDKAAEAAHRVRVDAEFVICRAMTVGEWVRAYGDNAVKADAWRKLCGMQITETPATPTGR